MPFTRTTSPGRARSPPRSTPVRMTPMPVVVMNSLSQAPRGTTLVSPVTIRTSAARAVSAIEAATFFNRSIGTPSSTIEAGLILRRGERKIVEGGDEHIVHQILHRLAAAAMRERHRRHVNRAESPLPHDGNDVHAAPRVLM